MLAASDQYPSALHGFFLRNTGSHRQARINAFNIDTCDTDDAIPKANEENLLNTYSMHQAAMRSIKWLLVLYAMTVLKTELLTAQVIRHIPLYRPGDLIGNKYFLLK